MGESAYNSAQQILATYRLMKHEVINDSGYFSNWQFVLDINMSFAIVIPTVTPVVFANNLSLDAVVIFFIPSNCYKNSSLIPTHATVPVLRILRYADLIYFLHR